MIMLPSKSAKTEPMPNAAFIQELNKKHFGLYTNATIAQLLKELQNNLVIADSIPTEKKWQK